MTNDDAQVLDSSQDAEDQVAEHEIAEHEVSEHEVSEQYGAEQAPHMEPPMEPRAPYNPPPAPYAGGSAPSMPDAQGYRRMPDKVPMTAALLSVVPGLGNIYNGLYARGLTFFFIEFSIIRMAAGVKQDENLAILIPSIFFFWLFNLFDAHRQAVIINLGGGDLARDEVKRSDSGGLLLAGVVMSVIGMIGVFDFYFDVDIWRLFDHWPALLLIGGLGLVSRALIARSAGERSAS